MCLQWCHVRNALIDNDLPCEMLCPESIRLAHAAETCETCIHYVAGLCALTKERIPQSRTCCHWNADPMFFDVVVLHLGVNVPSELMAAYGANSIREIFDQVDTAPDLPPDAPADGIVLNARDLTLPLVYGVCADCWEQAITGQSDLWCGLCRGKAS